MLQLSFTRCSCIAVLWVSLTSFGAITLCIASQRVFIVVSVYFIIDSVRKLLDTTSCAWPWSWSNTWLNYLSLICALCSYSVTQKTGFLYTVFPTESCISTIKELDTKSGKQHKNVCFCHLFDDPFSHLYESKKKKKHSIQVDWKICIVYATVSVWTEILLNGSPPPPLTFSSFLSVKGTIVKSFSTNMNCLWKGKFQIFSLLFCS
jgi:hypothetical protein